MVKEHASNHGWTPYPYTDPFSFVTAHSSSQSSAPTRFRRRFTRLSRYRYARAATQLPLEFRNEVARAGSKPLTSYRSIWMSDFHLGTSRCQAESLLDFLRHHQAHNLYLVGDIVDGWNFGPSWNFNDAQKAVAEEIAGWRKRGTCVEFLPGNHDQASLDLVETLLGLVPRRADLIHRTADGRRMLVTHGHQFDRSVGAGRWLKAGYAYGTALRIYQWYSGEWTHGVASIVQCPPICATG